MSWPVPLRTTLGLGALIGAMVLGSALVLPTLAEDSDAPRADSTTLFHQSFNQELGNPGTLSERLAIIDTRLNEADELFIKAGKSLDSGDDVVARALIKEAEELLGLRGGTPHAFTFGGHGGPMAWGPGSGEEKVYTFGFGGDDQDSEASTFEWNTDESAARNINVEIDGDQMKVTGEDKDGKPFTIEGTKDEVHKQLAEMGIKVHVLALDSAAPMAMGMGGSGECPAMAFGVAGEDNSNCKTINVEIDGDQYHISGETKDGQTFDVTGTPDEVHKALADKGIDVGELHQNLMQGHGGMMAFGSPALTKELRIEMPEMAFGHPGAGWNGTPMTAEEKANAEKKVAELTAKANDLFEAGKNDEAIAILQEAWGASLMLSIGGDANAMIQKIIINGDEDHDGGESSVGGHHKVVIRKEVKGDKAEASAPDRDAAESDRITQ